MFAVMYLPLGVCGFSFTYLCFVVLWLLLNGAVTRGFVCVVLVVCFGCGCLI